ncbi:PEP-utilizing enzyme [Streptomyces inhibens]|uniref:PEP-utilizing enzyme n=1 Tax=Streptomyces inhibens TaxID=2293571 RepID=UPI0037A6D00F
MARPTPQEYFRRHSALADWLAHVRPERRDAILAEDSTRAARLGLLHELMGLPILATTHFSGGELAARARSFESFRASAEGAYAVRAFHRSDESVLRNRNLPVPELTSWLESKAGDLDQYDIEFSPHMPNAWATIFVVTSDGVIGEVVRGSLRQLTQGDHTAASPSTYVYDFTDWHVEPHQPRYEQIARSVLEFTRAGKDAQTALGRRLDCGFTADGHLQGYYEAVVDPGGDLRFIDFNIALGRRLESSYLELIRSQQGTLRDEVHGLTASRGSAQGVARVLIHREADALDLADGEVLVCVEPTPDMIPLIARASALVADRGGLLSHCSVVCREMGIPCVVGTVNATEVIQSGRHVVVEADSGTVRVVA